VTDNEIVLVAHRAGNDPTVPSAAARVADIVELDVHLFRGRVEVRHSKALWPTSRLFEGRQLLPRSAMRPDLDRVLDSLPSPQRIWIDLKGPDPRLSGRVLDSLDGRERQEIWVSARCWWLLAPFRAIEGIRTLMSVGSAWQRPLARLCQSRGWSDGIVMHERLVSDAFIDQIPASAVRVAWAVNDLPRAVELLERGFDGLIIDDPSVINETRCFLDARTS
jgi:glycerophosphoryl diester phosphodiesterase